MQIKDADAPLTTNEREELKEPKKTGVSAGLKLMVGATAVMGAVAVVGGVAWSSGLVEALVGKEKPPEKGKPVAPSKPPEAPTLPVTLDEPSTPGMVGGDQRLCNGRHLPPGMPCPDAPSAAASAPADSSDGGKANGGGQQSSAKAGGDGQAHQRNEVRERKFRGDVLASGTGFSSNRPAGETRAQVQPVQYAPGAAPAGPAPAAGGFAGFAGATGSTGGGGSAGSGPATQLGSMLTATETTPAIARYKLNQDFILAKGTLPDCTLITAVRSSVPGPIKCVLSHPVYSMNGRVVLMDPGTVISGEYTSGNLGSASIFALWTDARTPRGVTFTFNSPTADPLGRAGMAGVVDMKWIERFGGALMFSVFNDALNIEMARAGRAQGDNNITQFPGTTGTAKSIVEEMLKQGSTTKPELYKNQGDIVRIYVMRDIDFSKVYTLSSAPADEAGPTE